MIIIDINFYLAASDDFCCPKIVLKIKLIKRYFADDKKSCKITQHAKLNDLLYNL